MRRRHLRRFISKGAYRESSLNEGGDSAWKQIAPFLDDAIASLDEKDRTAIVLRYIKGMSLKEVGAALGWSEDAAKKRVSRAVEKLRIFFDHRSVTLSGAVSTQSRTKPSKEIRLRSKRSQLRSRYRSCKAPPSIRLASLPEMRTKSHCKYCLIQRTTKSLSPAQSTH